jgi:hypothetical protein
MRYFPNSVDYNSEGLENFPSKEVGSFVTACRSAIDSPSISLSNTRQIHPELAIEAVPLDFRFPPAGYSRIVIAVLRGICPFKVSQMWTVSRVCGDAVYLAVISAGAADTAPETLVEASAATAIPNVEPGAVSGIGSRFLKLLSTNSECICERLPSETLQSPFPTVSFGGFASLIGADFPALFAEFDGKQFTLLWRGSGDGFRADRFNRRCDCHAPTLALIQDTELD